MPSPVLPPAYPPSGAGLTARVFWTSAKQTGANVIRTGGLLVFISGEFRKTLPTLSRLFTASGDCRFEFHPHARRNAFRRRDARLQSRSFARRNRIAATRLADASFPRSSVCQASIPSAPIGCGARIGFMQGKITRMERRRRPGLLVMNHLRGRR